MDRPAETSHPVHDIVKNRWSPRAFEPRPLDDAALASLLEAARWSPSSYNEQPWAFVVARRQDGEKFKRMLSCLVEFNQTWAQNAGVLILGCAAPKFDKNGKPNNHYRHDLGAALAWLTVEAEARGLRVHQMAGIDGEACRANLQIPEDFEPVTGVAVGHGGDPSLLPDELAEKEESPRSRKPLMEIVFDGTFGEPAGYV